MQKQTNLIIALLMLHTLTGMAFDRSFFYRTSSFWDEPRLEFPCLTTASSQLMGGSAKFTKFDNFCVSGIFDIFEADFNLYQNYHKGFFCHLHLPVVSVQTIPVHFCDKKNSCIDINFSENIFSGQVKNTGLSDSTIFIGRTINYENTLKLDYIDFSVQAGPLIPTGKTKNPEQLFDIPFGYNGHWGLAWCLDMSLGFYEWLTVGIHNDGVGFFNSKENIYVEDNQEFKKICVDMYSGPVSRTGAYLKADNVCCGLSFLTSLAYEIKTASRPVCPSLENKIINYEQFNQWSRWLIDFLIEYDFAQEGNFFNPNIAFLYNHQISGKNVLPTNMIGGILSVNINWTF